MSFKVLVEDEDGTRRVVHEVTDRRVTRVGFSGAQGEGGAMRVAHDQTEVLLTFEYVIQDGRPTLQDVEAMQTPARTGEEAQAAIDELATLPTSTNTGPNVMLAASDQGEASDEGGTNSEASPSGEEPSVEEDREEDTPVVTLGS